MRLSGVTLPKQKRIVIGLTYVYGIGLTASEKILEGANIEKDTRVKDLTRSQEDAIRAIVEKDITTEGDLRRAITTLQSAAKLRAETGSEKGMPIFRIYAQRNEPRKIQTPLYPSCAQ